VLCIKSSVGDPRLAISDSNPGLSAIRGRTESTRRPEETDHRITRHRQIFIGSGSFIRLIARAVLVLL
jgi:hypothetical protein